MTSTRARSTRERHGAVVVLLLLLILHAVINALWLERDKTLRSFDSGPYLQAVLHVYDLLHSQGLAGLLAALRGGDGGTWPCATFVPWAALAALFGHSASAIRLYNLVFLAVIFVSLYLLGRRLHSRRAGLLAAILVSLYPLLYGEARQIGGDVPGAAATTLGMLMLLRTDRFERTGWSVLFGVVVGVGTLVRPQVAGFLAAPALVLLVLAIWRPGSTGRLRILANLSLGLAASLLVSAVWWWGRAALLLRSFLWHQQGGEVASVDEPSALFYLKVLPAVTSPYLLLVLLLALGVILMQRRQAERVAAWLHDPGPALLLAWLVGGALFISTFQVRGLRYLLPLCPALALITALGLTSIPKPQVRRMIVAMTLGVACLVWLFDSFSFNTLSVLGYRDDPASVGPRQFYLSSGPPDATALYVAAEELAQPIRSRHDDGRGVEIHLRYQRGEGDMRLNWTMSPVLMSILPGVRITMPDEERSLTEMHVGRASVPLIRRPCRQAYVLNFEARPPGGWTRGLVDAVQISQKRVIDHFAMQGLWITLWRLPSCRTRVPGSAAGTV